MALLSLLPETARKGLVVDAHADRPTARGILPPGATKVLARLPADPTFAEIHDSGATLELYHGTEGHTVLGGTVWVSGEIPRAFEYENGLKGSVAWDVEKKEWAADEVSPRAKQHFVLCFTCVH